MKIFEVYFRPSLALRYILGLACMLLLVAGVAFSADISETDLKTRRVRGKGTAQAKIQKFSDDAEKQVAQGDYSEAARSYLNASFWARSSGSYQKAISWGKESIICAEKSGEKDIRVKTRAMLAVGMAYYLVADHTRALEYYEKAAQFARENNLKGLEARANELTGNVFRSTDLQKTLMYHKKAYDYYASKVSDDLSRTYAPSSMKTPKILQAEWHVLAYIEISISLAGTYISLGEYDTASAILKKALPYTRERPAKQLRINIYYGDLNKKLGDLPAALENYQQACSAAQSLDLPYFIVQACKRTGRELRDAGKKEESVKYFQLAIDAIEDTRSMLQSEEMRSNYFEQTITIYNEMISVLIDLRRSDEAFAFSERGRARTFLDLLGNKTDLSRGRASLLIDEEMNMRNRMSELQLKLEEDDSPEVKKEIDEFKAQYLSFLERLRKEDPEHADLVSVNTSSLGEVQSYLQPKQTLLQYHVLKSRTILWIVTRESWTTAVIRQDADEFRAALSDLRKSIAETAPMDQVKPRLRTMYDILLAKARIRPGDALTIVPHDMLHYLPFHALIRPDGRYLLEENAISYLPSSTMLRFVRNKHRKVDENILAFGNPDLGNPALSLRYSEREVLEIKKLYPKSRVYTGNKATKSTATSLAPNSNVLHFALHTEMNEESPKETALMLSGDGSDDGKLTVEEIFGLDLPASIVILSACESGLGTLSRGDELVGLSRSFIYAGSPTVITTLWKVNDKSSFFLMREFYKNMNSMSKIQALRTAQLNVMQTYPHPFYWAPYQLTGNSE